MAAWAVCRGSGLLPTSTRVMTADLGTKFSKYRGRTLGKCSECPRELRVLSSGVMPRHKQADNEGADD